MPSGAVRSGMSQDWTDRFVGDRMTLDQEFSDRVSASGLSSQEWGLVMTAVEFEIEGPEDPETATVVANTDSVDQMGDAMAEVNAQVGAMGGAPGSARSGGDGGGGFLGSIKSALGLGGGGGGSGSDEAVETGKRLAEEYATAFEKRLRERGSWERACRLAAEGEVEDSASDGMAENTDGAANGTDESDEDEDG